MSPERIAALAGIFLAYVFIAIFRAATAALSPAALKRILQEEARSGRRGGDPLGIRVAFDVAHHLTLIGASILLVAFLSLAGSAHPYRWSALTLVLGAVAAQVAGRLVAVADPEGAFTLTWRVAAILYAPFEILARPLFRTLERLRLSARREWAEEEPEAAAEEIAEFLDAGRREGLIAVEEGRLIRQVVDFHDRVVREVMTPRTAIVAVRAEATLRELRDLMVAEKHSRIPVFRGQIDSIEGIVFLKDLLACWGSQDEGAPIAPLVRPAYFVPETKQVGALLRELQARRTQVAIVVDEYGGTAGVVTIEDLLEEIVGEIQEEHDLEEKEIAAEADGRLLLRGTVPIDTLNETLAVDLPAEGYDTVSGLIFSVLGRIPRAGESIEHSGLRFEVVKADSRRIHQVRVSRTSGAPARAARSSP